MSTCRVVSLHVYPVKSCRGVNLDEANLCPTGVTHDREWVVVDTDGRFVSQRSAPVLATVQPTLLDDGLHMQAPGMEALVVDHCQRGRSSQISVWKTSAEALDQGDEAADWFTRLTGQPCRLWRANGERLIGKEHRHAGFAGAVAFGDAYPLHVISEATVRALGDVDAARFRANIVVDGAMDPGEEDSWEVVRIGDVRARVVKACKRCTIPDVDQVTGRSSASVVPLLRQHRHGHRVDPDGTALVHKKGTFFGQYLVHEGPMGSLVRVGDGVDVESRRGQPNVSVDMR